MSDDAEPQLHVDASLAAVRISEHITSGRSHGSLEWSSFLNKEDLNVILFLLQNKKYVTLAFRTVRYHEYQLGTFCKVFSYVSPDLAVKLIDSDDATVLKSAFSLGFYSDLSKIDSLVSSTCSEIRTIAARYCSTEALRSLKTDKESSVRKIAFERLGPSECLDLMLKDKVADIRADAIKLAPFSYPGLSSMTGEIARYPFQLLIEKISEDHLPMMLGNRNVKDNRYISSALEQRMSAIAGRKK